MGEACNAGCKCTAHVSVNKCHLGSLIIILVVHIVDKVKGIDIKAGKPVHHHLKSSNDLVIIKVIRCYPLVGRSHLLTVFGVNASVEGIEQALCKVCTGAEELHLLAGLSCRNTAADGIIVSPYGLHNVVVLILHGACGNGNL